MLKKILHYICVVIGCLIAAGSINIFLVQHHLLSGGLSGIGIISYYLFGLPAGTVTLALNVPLLIAAWRMLGKKYVTEVLFATVMFSVCLDATEFLTHQYVTDDILLADEVSDLNVRAFDDEFHGEVCVCGLHDEAVALGDTGHHVVDVGDDGLWDSVQLGAWEPAGDEDGVALDSHLQWAHVEVALELTAWAGNGDFLVLQGDCAAFVDLDVSSVLELHTTRKRKEWSGG